MSVVLRLVLISGELFLASCPHPPTPGSILDDLGFSLLLSYSYQPPLSYTNISIVFNSAFSFDCLYTLFQMKFIPLGRALELSVFKAYLYPGQYFCATAQMISVGTASSFLK